MRKAFILFSLLILCLLASIDGVIEEALNCPFIYNSVNVITGDYAEVRTDLNIDGPYPLKIRRCFADRENPKQGWHFNLPNLLNANSSKPTEEKYPHHKTIYEYDKKNFLISLKTTDINHLKEYHNLTLHYQLNENPECKITAHTGQSVTYRFVKQDENRYRNPLLLKQVILPNQSSISYTYIDHPTERRKLISKIDYPNGRYLINEYYQPGSNMVGKECINIGPSHLSVGKVKLQKEPVGPDGSPIITHRFFYHSDFTEEYNALDNKTIYRFSSEGKLTAIEKFNQEKNDTQKIYRVDKIFWSKEQANSPSRIISRTQEDGEGNIHSCQTFLYNDLGQIIQETLYGNLSGKNNIPVQLDSSGIPLKNGVESYSTSYFYSEEKTPKLIREIEQNGKTTQYFYDPDTSLLKMKLIGINDSICNRQFYRYNSEGQLTESISDNGTSKNEYNLENVTQRVISRVSYTQSGPASGLPAAIEESYFDAESGKEKLLKRTVNHYDGCGNLIQQDLFDADNQEKDSLSFQCDAAGSPINSFSASGKSQSSSYDSNGNLLSVNVHSGEKGTTINNTYDNANRLVCRQETDTSGNSSSISYRYDLLGNKITSIDSFGNETHYEYDALGRCIKTIFPQVLDENDASIQPVILQEYDIFDHVNLTIDPKGYKITKKYNIRGKLTEVVYPDGTQETYQYKLDGSLERSIDKIGCCNTFETDAMGRIITARSCDAKGSVINQTSCTYQGMLLHSSTDSQGIKTLFHYDHAGRLISIQKHTSEGTCRTDLTYDSTGKVKSTQEWFGQLPQEYIIRCSQNQQNSHSTSFRLEDSQGMPLKETLKTKNSEPSFKEECFLNNRGQHVLKSSLTDSKGITTTTIYDALGRAESIIKTNPFGITISHAEIRWDPCGNKGRETYYAGEGRSQIVVKKWTYGPNNRLVEKVEYPDTIHQKKTEYAYNSKGQLSTIFKPDGVAINYSYHPNGKIYRFYASDNSFDYAYHYDAALRISSVEDRLHNTLTERTYTETGHLLSDNLGNGLRITCQRDLTGRITNLTLPDNSCVLYAYDGVFLRKIQRLSSTQEPLYTHTYSEYDQAGRLAKAEMIEELGSIDLSYDENGRIVSIQTPYWSQTIPEEGYDSFNNLTASTVRHRSGEFHNQYEYDETNQLIKESGVCDAFFTYDRVGNRLMTNEREMLYNEVNELISDVNSDYRYDKNGNLIEKKCRGEIYQFSYDALNRLTEVTINKGSLVQYTYDAFDRRLSKTTSEWNKKQSKWIVVDVQKFIYEGNHEIGSLDSSEHLSELRVLGIGHGAEIGASIAIEIGGKTYAPIHDHRGSICALVDCQRKDLANVYNYSAFGQEDSCENVSNPWKFSGKRKDPETGFIYFGHRYYDPDTGRWITKDPLEDIDGPNQYAYVKNNPLAHADLYGLFSFSDFWNDCYTGASSFYSNLSSFFHQADHYIKTNLSYSHYVEEELGEFSEVLFGKAMLVMLGFYKDKAAAGSYGQGEINDKIRITMINGILNIRKDCVGAASMISKSHGDINVHFVYRPTQGWARDILISCATKFGYVSPHARQLAEKWKELIHEMGGTESGGKILHYAHSIGGTETMMAKTLLTPEETKMIRVISFGSPSLIPDEDFDSVVNYVSCCDGVSMLDPLRYSYGLLNYQRNIVFLGSYWGIPIIDHALNSNTYRSIIETLGAIFIENYLETND